MKQVVHRLRTGQVSVGEFPDPAAGPQEVLIANSHSVLSSGTEKAALDLARKSIVGKALERPDQVRRVLEKLRTEGFLSTVRQVQGRLDEAFPLGYSSAGVVLAVGRGVRDLRPGDRVASNGPHAGVVVVPRNLCARVPDSVPLDLAAYGVLGAVALNAVRLSKLGLGETAFVVGLGLVGQLTCALLKASGCRVLGTDPDPWKCSLALRMGADEASPSLDAEIVVERTRGAGADAVLIAASTPSDGPITLAADAVRAKGKVVAIGAVGLNLPRRPFYFKEADFVVSCSYGPGRYDAEYEERGHDYPMGHVRWTEQRNLQAILDLLASGRIDLAPLTTHRFPVDDAGKAYAMIEAGKEAHLGVLLEYPKGEGRRSLPIRVARARSGAIGIGALGAGVFAKGVLLPALVKIGSFRPRVICAQGGVSAVSSAERFGFETATTDPQAVFDDPQVSAVFVMTPHDLHAAQVCAALKAGKHVFVEKPLALTLEELAAIEDALANSSSILMVGFNRRFSPAAVGVRQAFASVSDPLTISIRMNVGTLPADHWSQSEEIGGGRLIGEACHAIDLATYLAGSPPVRVYAECVGGGSAPKICDDQAFVTLRHANGAVSSIAYLAGGDRACGKERVEVLGGGCMAEIDDFKEVTLAVRGKIRREKRWTQDKGHVAEIEAFAKALASGGPSPIPWEDLRAVTLASILAVRSLREGIPFDLTGAP